MGFTSKKDLNRKKARRDACLAVKKALEAQEARKRDACLAVKKALAAQEARKRDAHAAVRRAQAAKEPKENSGVWQEMECLANSSGGDNQVHERDLRDKLQQLEGQDHDIHIMWTSGK